MGNRITRFAKTEIRRIKMLSYRLLQLPHLRSMEGWSGTNNLLSVMLGLLKDVIFFKKNNHSIFYNRFHYFANDRNET